MKARRTQNSAIFLATLGVYLGLVLTGGTPHVFAHAALAREYDVREEVEFRDDLDNKPDDERSPVTMSVQIYLEDVEYFLSSLSKLRTAGKFDPAKDTFNVVQRSMQPCVDHNIAGRYTPITFDTTSEAARPSMEYFRRGMIYGYSLGDCILNNEFDGKTAVDTRFNYKLDSKGFEVNVTVVKETKQRALDLIHSLENTFRQYETGAKTKLRLQIIKNTRFRAENDQVLVVLRLPRGSLTSLLTDAK